MRRPEILSIVLLASLAGACASEPERPEPPDMTLLLEEYERPTARFDESMLRTLVPVVGERIDIVDHLDGLDSIDNEILAPVRDTSQEPGGELPLDLSAEGFVRIHRVCGADANGSDVDRQGELTLTALFDSGQFAPVFWGQFDACRFPVSSEVLVLDGDIAIHYAPPVVIFDLDLLLGVGHGKPRRAAFSFRAAGGVVESLLETDSGTLAVGIDASGAMQVRAANGHWTCNITAETCVARTR